MKIRIAPLIITAVFAAAAGFAQAAVRPKDPDKAQIASVDRFSDTGGTFLRRSTDPNLPGPNEPIDFDQQPSAATTTALNTLGLSAAGKSVLYYELDAQSTTPAPVYILYRDGENRPVPGQLDVIDTIPGDKGYNDFRQVWKVQVPRDYVANTITDAATLLQSGYKKEKTDKLINMPVVPDKSHARYRFKGGTPELQRAWYGDQVAKFLVFDEAPLLASVNSAPSSVPVSPIYDGFTANPGQPNGEKHFCTEPNTLQTHNVVATVPGDKDYSPLWVRIVYDSAACASVHDLATATRAKVVPADVYFINCPIELIK
jgi:hypothetical protein